MSNDTMSTSNTSDLDVGNVPSIPTSSANVPNATSQKRKICKPQTPVLDVVSVMNIIDCTAKCKNGFTTKLSKNVSDFSTITSNALSKCGQLTKNHLAENLLTLINYCAVIPRPPSTIGLSRGQEPVPAELFEKLKAEIELFLETHTQDLGKSHDLCLTQFMTKSSN